MLHAPHRSGTPEASPATGKLDHSGAGGIAAQSTVRRLHPHPASETLERIGLNVTILSAHAASLTAPSGPRRVQLRIGGRP